MQLDSTTLMVLIGVVVALCGVSFILNTAFNRNDSVGRIWSLAFIAAMMVVVTYDLTVTGPNAWWPIVVGNAALAIAVGAVWSGARRYNGRSSGGWVVVVVAIIPLIAALVHGPAAGHLAGATELGFGLALLAGLGGVETLRGRLRRNLNGRILTVALWITAVLAVGRATVLVIDSATGTVFNTYFNDETVLALTLALIVVASCAVSVLRAERSHGNAVGDLTDGIHSAAGVLSAQSFAQAAVDHLERARPGRVGLALIGTDIDNLPEINAAFGRAAGDEAISQFAQKLRGSAPVLALIGHRASGRFFVLATVASATEARVLAERIHTSLVDEPLREAFLIRITASFGIADTFDHGYDLLALSRAVDTAIDSVKQTGGNGIAVVTAAPANPHLS